MAQKESRKRYYEKNKEREKERMKIYRQTPEFRERHRLKMAEYRKNNPDKCKAISDKSRLKNGEKYNAKRKERYNTDPDFKQKKKESELKYLQSGKRHEQRKNYRIGREKELREKSKEWAKNNPDRVKEKMRQYKDNYWIEHEKQQRHNLEDCHVIKLIKKQTRFELKTEDISKELIELKRQSLLLKRTIKKN